MFCRVSWELRPAFGNRRPEGQHVDVSNMLSILVVGSATFRTKFENVAVERAENMACPPRRMKKIAPPSSLQSFNSLLVASLDTILCDMLAKLAF